MSNREVIVYQYTPAFEYVNEFDSIGEASRITNINQGNIVAVCKGRNKTAGGFLWSYSILDDDGEPIGE